MKVIQNILKKTKASKLLFSMMVVFMVILNVSPVEAKSLKKGEEFKKSNGGAIRVISSVEVEIQGGDDKTFQLSSSGISDGKKRGDIFLGKYTVDGDRVRVVTSALGTTMVSYYIITPDGLVEEKDGTVFYSKDGLQAKEKKAKAAEKNRIVAAATAFAARFTINDDEVTDKKTGLIWRRCAEGMNYSGGTCTGTTSKFTHKQALELASAQYSSTGKAWRVPEKDELSSIVDNSYKDPAINPAAFPATPSGWFWSSSPYVDYDSNAWFVNFADNPFVGVVSHVNRSYPYYVRLVRAGQKDADTNAKNNTGSPAGTGQIGAMVRIPGKDYELGRYEVTQGEWKALMGTNPSKFTNCGDTCPVEQVSWDDIQIFLQKLNAKSGRQYRLPTETEWEYACYGGNKTEYCGSNDIDSVTWYGNIGQAGGNSNQTTHPSGQKQANGYGLYDMSGNVWEWQSDCWEGDCAKRVVRGGSWFDTANVARASNRFKFGAAYRVNVFGFRLARTLP